MLVSAEVATCVHYGMCLDKLNYNDAMFKYSDGTK